MVSNNNSFQNYNGWARYKIPTAITWGAGGTSLTITDANIHPNSQVELWATGSSVQPAGNWSYTYNQGSCVITSSNSENSAMTLNYVIF